MLQRQAKKLRRLSNLLGCRDPEYDEPSASRSGTPSDPAPHHEGDDVSSSYAYHDGEGAVTQEVCHDDIYPFDDALLTISSHTVFPYLLLMHRLLMI